MLPGRNLVVTWVLPGSNPGALPAPWRTIFHELLTKLLGTGGSRVTFVTSTLLCHLSRPNFTGSQSIVFQENEVLSLLCWPGDRDTVQPIVPSQLLPLQLEGTLPTITST